MPWNSDKQKILDKFKAVIESLDETQEGDKLILSGAFNMLKGCLITAEAQAANATAGGEFGEEGVAEEAGDFGAEEGGDFGGEEGAADTSGDFGGDFGEEGVAEEGGDFGAEEGGDFGGEEGGDFGAEDGGADFGEPEPAPKPARGRPAAAPADPFAGQTVQQLIDSLKNAGADMTKVKAAFDAKKRDGLVEFAKKVDKLGHAWLAYLEKASIPKAEEFAKKKGIVVKYGRGPSNDAKKKTVIADALAAKLIPLPVK